MHGKPYIFQSIKAVKQNVYFANFLDGEEICWMYAKIFSHKVEMLEGLSSLFPLKLRITDYGKIVEHGKGAEPPKEIAWKIENGDFLTEEPTAESEIFFIASTTNDGKEFFHYVKVPYYLTSKFSGLIGKNKEFELTLYGEILYSDWGKPTAEIAALMLGKHGIETPAF